MVITDALIEVDDKMLNQHKMWKVRSSGIKVVGIHVNPLYPERGMEWVRLDELQQTHYDRIELYFAFLQYRDKEQS